MSKPQRGAADPCCEALAALGDGWKDFYDRNVGAWEAEHIEPLTLANYVRSALRQAHATPRGAVDLEREVERLRQALSDRDSEIVQEVMQEDAVQRLQAASREALRVLETADPREIQEAADQACYVLRAALADQAPAYGGTVSREEP